MALVLALESAGSNIEARIAMMAMTTSNSMSVKARFRWPVAEFLGERLGTSNEMFCMVMVRVICRTLTSVEGDLKASVEEGFKKGCTATPPRWGERNREPFVTTATDPDLSSDAH